MAFLFLDDNEAESLLNAAREGQAAKLELIENIEKNLNDAGADMSANLDSGYYDVIETSGDYYDISDLRHFQAEHARTSRLIDEVEKRLTFSLVDDKSVPMF